MVEELLSVIFLLRYYTDTRRRPEFCVKSWRTVATDRHELPLF